jgi:hypothetical protein
MTPPTPDTQRRPASPCIEEYAREFLSALFSDYEQSLLDDTVEYLTDPANPLPPGCAAQADLDAALDALRDIVDLNSPQHIGGHSVSMNARWNALDQCAAIAKPVLARLRPPKPAKKEQADVLP